jgi:hypothetical protein
MVSAVLFYKVYNSTSEIGQVRFLPDAILTSLNRTCMLTIGSYLIADILRKLNLYIAGIT